MLNENYEGYFDLLEVNIDSVGIMFSEDIEPVLKVSLSGWTTIEENAAEHHAIEVEFLKDGLMLTSNPVWYEDDGSEGGQFNKEKYDELGHITLGHEEEIREMAKDYIKTHLKDNPFYFEMMNFLETIKK